MSQPSPGLRHHPRFVRDLVLATLADTPVTVLQGARQVGKSTLVREIVQEREGRLLTLDAEPVYQAAIADPDAFVRQARGMLAIDEVQRVPALIRAIKGAVDEDRRPGRFLVTGSANLLELPGTEESLAGRAETVPLYGLSRGELEGRRETFVDRIFSSHPAQAATSPELLTRDAYLETLCAGSYPEALGRGGSRRDAWFDNYVRRIVSRDAREVSRLPHLDRLPDLLRLLAANNAGELVKARLGRAAGIPETSVPMYVDLLETLYLIHRLPAWGDNLSARVTGRPKVALLDTGLTARLNRLTPEAMAPGTASEGAGGLFESFVAGELRRQLTWSATAADLCHFRDRDGREVDIVMESSERRIVGIEVKAAGTVTAKSFRGLEFLRSKLGSRFVAGVVFYTGREPLPFGDRLWALPYSTLWA